MRVMVENVALKWKNNGRLPAPLHRTCRLFCAALKLTCVCGEGVCGCACVGVCGYVVVCVCE